MIVSGWAKPTWRLAPVRTTMQHVGWTTVCGGVPTTKQSGGARLDWAVTTNRIAEAKEAVKHLPAEQSSPAQVHKLAAWIAKNRGDEKSERRDLERLIDTDPADFEAIDRLIDLAVKHKQPQRATELRQLRSEIETLEIRYLKLFERNQPLRDAAEMAHIANRIGRRFEAKAFRTVADAVIAH